MIFPPCQWGTKIESPLTEARRTQRAQSFSTVVYLKYKKSLTATGISRD